MKAFQTVAVFACAALLVPMAVQAQQKEPQQLTEQQQRMKSCNAEASGKHMKGDERKSFMSTCLKGEAATGKTAQQEKMVTCNREAKAKQMKGDERKSFMSQCLRAKPGSAATGR